MKGYKPRDPLSLHGVIAQAYSELGGVEAVSETVLTERTKNWLYVAATPDLEARKQARLTLDEAVSMTRSGANAFAAHFAYLAGAALIPLEAADTPAPDQADVVAHIARLGQEAGEAMAEVASAYADRKFSPHEVKRCRKEVLDVIAACHGILGVIGAAS
jgi:hypothetical protein